MTGSWAGTLKSSEQQSPGPALHIGILRADSVLDQFQPAHGDYPAMFQRVLDQRGLLADAPGTRALEFSSYDAQQGEFPPPGTCDAYLITGSRHSVYDELPWIAELVAFLREALAEGRKVIGICFGHQLIAHFFGGQTRPADDGWCVGVQHAAVISEQPWMLPTRPSFGLLSSHRDQVVRLPTGARQFARGSACPNAGFVVGDQILTFQGHPEFTRDYALDLLTMRQELLGANVFEQGVASLRDETDTQLVARWILNFLMS
jgi:GMP synthase-like glutamine amidotransferase